MPTNPAHALAHKIAKTDVRVYRPSEPWGVKWRCYVIRHTNPMDKTSPVKRCINTGAETFRTKADAIAYITESLTDPTCTIDPESNLLVFDRTGLGNVTK